MKEFEYEDEYLTTEKVKAITVPVYEHTEAGLDLTLRDMTIYLLNEDDFEIEADSFDPETHEHSIPKFEMARIYILVCAMTGNTLGFRPEERETDPTYAIYERAYQKLVRSEQNKNLFLGIAKVGIAAGFQAPLHETH